MHPSQALFLNPLEQAPALGIALCLAAGIGLSALEVLHKQVTADAWLLATVVLAMVMGCICMYAERRTRRDERENIVQRIRRERQQKKWYRVSAAVVLLAAGGTLGAWHTEQTEVGWPSHPTEWEAQVVRVNRMDSADVQVDVALRHQDLYGKRVRLKI